MYFFTVSIFAPPVVVMKYPVFQKWDFHNNSRISGCSFLINLLLELLYALINLLNSVCGEALNKDMYMIGFPIALRTLNTYIFHQYSQIISINLSKIYLD